MRFLKNVLSIIVTAAICGLCIAGIVFLNRNSSNKDSEIDLSKSESDSYSTYSKYISDYTTLKQTIKTEGMIVQNIENPIEEISYYGSIDDMNVKQGESFHKDDAIYITSRGAYSAKYSGKVDKVSQDGNYVKLTLVNYEKRYISAKIKFENIKYLDMGGKITFLYDDKSKEGTVSYIATTVNDGYVDVELAFEDADMEMLPYAPVTIVLVKAQVDNCIAVPDYAIIKNSNNKYLRIEGTDGEPMLVEVTTGLEGDGGYVEITSGISIDDVILIDAAQNAKGNLNTEESTEEAAEKSTEEPAEEYTEESMEE